MYWVNCGGGCLGKDRTRTGSEEAGFGHPWDGCLRFAPEVALRQDRAPNPVEGSDRKPASGCNTGSAFVVMPAARGLRVTHIQLKSGPAARTGIYLPRNKIAQAAVAK